MCECEMGGLGDGCSVRWLGMEKIGIMQLVAEYFVKCMGCEYWLEEICIWMYKIECWFRDLVFLICCILLQWKNGERVWIDICNW